MIVWCLIWRYTACNYASRSLYRVHHRDKKTKSGLYYFPQKALKVSRSNFADLLVSTWRKSWSHLLAGEHSRGSIIRDYNNLDVRVKKKCWANHNAVQDLSGLHCCEPDTTQTGKITKNPFVVENKDTFLTLFWVERNSLTLVEAATLI